MSYVSLDLAKLHLNIESDYTDDDYYLEHLIESAEGYIEGDGRISLVDYLDEDGDLKPLVAHGVLMMVAELYLHREATSDKKLYTDCIDRIVNLVRRYGA